MLNYSIYNKELKNKLVKLNATSQHFLSNLLNNQGVGMCIHEVIYNEYGFACNYKVLKANHCFYTTVDCSSGPIEGKEIISSEIDIDPLWTNFYKKILAEHQISDGSSQQNIELEKWTVDYFFDNDYLIITIYEHSKVEGQVNNESSLVQVSARIFQQNGFFITVDTSFYVRSIAMNDIPEAGYGLNNIIGKPIQDIPGFNNPSIQNFLRIAIQGHKQKFDFTINHKKFDCRTFPLMDSTGNVEFVAFEGEVQKESSLMLGDIFIKDAIIEHATAGLAITDKDGYITYANPAILSMWHLEFPTDSIGIHASSFWADKTEYERLFSELMNNGTCDDKILARRKDGNEFWVKLSAQIIKDHNNQVLGIVGSVIDINSEVEAQNSVEISKNNFKHFYNTIPDFLIVFDQNFKILEINNYVTAYLGYNPEDLKNSYAYQLYKNISEKRFHKMLDDLFELKKDRYSCKMLASDGQEIAVETIIFKGQWNNQPAYFSINKDISELQQSEEKFTKAFHTNPAIVALSELDSARYIGVNETFSKKLGYQVEEVIGVSSIELGITTFEQRDQLVRLLKKGEKIHELNQVLVRKNGELLYALISAEILSFQGKKYLYIVAQDITHQRRFELMQNQIVQLYHQMEKATEKELACFAIDASASLIKCNSGFIHFIHTNQVDIDYSFFKDKSSDRFLFVNHNNSKWDLYPEGWRTCLLDQKPVIVNNDSQIKFPDDILNNTQEINRYACIPVFDGNKVAFTFGLYNKTNEFTHDDLCLIETLADNLWNIFRMKRTEKALIESENRLKEAQQIANLGLWEYNLLTGEVNFSDEVREIINFKEPENIIDFNRLLGFIFPDDRDIVEQKIQESLANHEAIEAEHRVILSDGTIRYLNQKFTTRFDHNNQPEKLIGIMLDITPQRIIQNELIEANQKLKDTANKLRDNQMKLETRNNEYQTVNQALKRNLERISYINIELNKVKEKAEESNKLKTAFLQNLSHEVRTPMNGIVGFAGMLNLPGLTDEKRKYFTDIIVSSTDQLLNIINDMLDFSRIEAGQVEIRKSRYNVNELMAEVQERFEFEIQNKKLEMITQVALPDNHCMIFSDKEKHMKIWICLLSNALKFTSTGSIEFGYIMKPGYYQFFIKDTGIGIARENHSIIFERFRQVEETFSRNYGGNGLGLSICKGYLDLLDGKIWLDSELGKGSTFYYTLPINEQIETDISVEPAETPIFSDKTILIVEDELLNFLYLDEVLTGIGIQTLHAKNGFQAIEMYQQNPKIDLVLMDIKMPEMDGIEATRRLKQINTKLPIIIQTAYAIDKEKQNAFEAGCDAFMSKPLRKIDLVNNLTEIFNKKS